MRFSNSITLIAASSIALVSSSYISNSRNKFIGNIIFVVFERLRGTRQ